MTQEIDRRALRAFFLPYAEQAHLAKHRVHIHAGQMHYCSGYVCEAREHEVGQYSDAINAIRWIPYAEIDSLDVCNRDGDVLQSFIVTDGGKS